MHKAVLEGVPEPVEGRGFKPNFSIKITLESLALNGACTNSVKLAIATDTTCVVLLRIELR